MKSFQLRFTCCLLSLAISCTAALAHDDNDGKGIGGAGGAGSGGGGPYSSHNIDMLSHIPLDQLGSLGASNVLGNDVWGWTHAPSGREFAIMGLTNGTSFVEVTNPTAPRYLGTLKTTAGTGNRAWRDMKVYKDQAYIVSDGNGAHGVQVFDLPQLLNAGVSDPNNPHYFSEIGVYTGVTNAHNIAINEESGFGYVVGSNQASGGLHVLNLNGGVGGAMPTFVGNFSADGYSHDAQIVNYIGPDADYAGREVAFNSNEDTLTIVDVTDKANMAQISRSGYSGSKYAHQGWLSEDHQFFYMNDELDEKNSSTLIQTRTRVWDVSNLDNPIYKGYHEGEAATIDHNLYVKGDFMFQANYTSGMRVLRINDPANLDFKEYAYFDTFSANDAVNFNGAWSVFPYFDSGTLLVSDRQGGLFVLTMTPEPGSLLLFASSTMYLLSRRRRSRVV